jgi:phosphoglycerate dehydrogenase-like enzyme
MMKPILVMDHFPRTLEMLFTPEDFGRLNDACTIVGGTNWPMPSETIAQHLEDMTFFVGARPNFDRSQLEKAENLKAIVEVSGHFPATIDYDAAFARGIRCLSCAPGFTLHVAEMALGLMLAGGRGIVSEHEIFRRGGEHWNTNNTATDFSLFKQRIGMVGYGSIARNLTRLLAPFSPRIMAYDPWLKPEDVPGIELASLEDVVTRNRCVVIAATPTDENYRLVNAELIGKMPRGTLVVLISRAHLVDFGALIRAAKERRIRAAIDVFPSEPVADDDPVRAIPNVILSPHRAGSVEGSRHPIGRMIADDVLAIIAGREPSQLQRAEPTTISHRIRAAAAAKAGENDRERGSTARPG